MSVEENKAIVRRAIEELWNKGNLGALDEFWSPDYAHHDPVAPQARDLAGYKKFLSSVLPLFVDPHIVIDDMLAEGDKVTVRYTWRATVKGGEGVSWPAGKQLTSTGIDVSRIVDGKIVEVWVARDRFSLAGQVGEIPAGRRADFPWGWPE